MAKLDSTIYDLTTYDGQSTAVSDLIDEMNSSTQDSELLNYFNIAVYNEISMAITPGYTSPFTQEVSQIHGLNYKPAFKAYSFNPATGFYLELPEPYNIDLGSTPSGFSPLINFYVDDQKAYLQYIDNNSAPTPPITVAVSYYLFSLPMPT